MRHAIVPGPESLSDRIAAVVGSIPRGRVATYGAIAAAAGNPRAARLVVWTLNARSRRDGLPWHRVLGLESAKKRLARVSLPEGNGRDLQIALLLEDGIEFDPDGLVDLEKYGWIPTL